MHAYPRWWPMAAKLLTWGFKANGKVNPVGELVQPLPPPALPVEHVAAEVAPERVAGTNHHTGRTGLIETLLVMVTAFAAGMTAVRRILPQRRKNLLSLPRY